MRRKILTKGNIVKVFVGYGIHLWAILFITNIALLYAVHFLLIGATCMTPQQVSADSRCLYIYGNQIFNVGTSSSPHHGHPCGTDVTSVLPSSHVGNQASYLLPNFVADVCAAVSPTPTVTPVASVVPSLIPSTMPSVPVSTIPSPSPTPPSTSPTYGCLGSCPIPTPTSAVPSNAISSPPIPSIPLLSSNPSVIPSVIDTNPGGGNNGNNGISNGFLSQILQLLQKLISLLSSIFNGGGGSGHHSHSGHGDKD